MAKVTSKYQVTIPKAIADEHRIKPGDDIEWTSAGESIRIRKSVPRQNDLSASERLKRFDEATARQKRRQKGVRPHEGQRGWKREDLYERGRAR